MVSFFSYLNILSLIFVLLICSCQPKIDFKFDNEDSKLVIWSVLHPDSIVSAYLSKTSDPLSKNVDRRISKCKVILYENNIAIDTLKEDSIGYYKSKKGYKPQEGKIYQLIATKESFDTLKTPKDTMPDKPVVLKTIFEDSVRSEQSSNIARITIITNQPSHFRNYGFGRFRSEGLPWSNDTVFGGIFKNDSGSAFNEDGVKTCEDNGFLFFLGYSFVNPSCKFSNSKYELYNFWEDKPYYKNVKFNFKICAITYKSLDMIKALNKLASQFTDDSFSGINIFWTPVQLPTYIENGFGFFACYNTTDIKVSPK